MKNSSHHKERRDHPRIMISLPTHFEIEENGSSYPGLTIDASQSGLLIQTLKEMPVGIKLDIEVFLPKKLRQSRIRAETEIIWKGVGYWEDWEGYEYGLKITHISNEDCTELSRILSDPTCLQEVYFAEDPHHNPTLVVRTK
jgi:hypothetical protein